MVKFDVNSLKSEILHVYGLLCPNHLIFKLKKYRRVISHSTDIRNLVNFHPTTQKSENFNGLFLSKLYEVWAKKYGVIYRVIFSDTKPWCKIWINPGLVFSKLAWGIGWTFIRAIRSLKNCTLMGSLCPKHMFQLEHFKGIMCHDTERWCKL